MNSALAAVLDTAMGKVFVKGIRTDHPGVITQQREAMINPHVRPLAPAMLWHLDSVAGWDVLGFEYVEGRHPDYTPGSADLPVVVEAMRAVADLPCPDLPLKDARQRWAAYFDQPAAAEMLAGNTLLHTDYNPANMLIPADGTARMIDWAWPTRGTAWIDPCCLLVRLVAAGHTVAQAETWARRSDAWHTAPDASLDAFALASARMWDDIASADPQPWKTRMATAAREWAGSRLAGVLR